MVDSSDVYEPTDCAQASRLTSLHALVDDFEVDGFQALTRATSSSRSRLLRFNAKRKEAANVNHSSSETLDSMLTFSPDPIPMSLLKLSGENSRHSTRMFESTLTYMGESGSTPGLDASMALAQRLLKLAIERPELRDELYMHLVKQTRGNPGRKSLVRGLELFLLLSSTAPPSKPYVKVAVEHLESLMLVFDCGADETERRVLGLASETLSALQHSSEAGPRMCVPAVEELLAALRGQHLQTVAFFLDDTFEVLRYGLGTTARDAVRQVADSIRLTRHAAFALFEVRRSAATSTGARGAEAKPVDRRKGAGGHGDGGAATGPGAPLTSSATAGPHRPAAYACNREEHVRLDDHAYIGDVIAEMRRMRGSAGGGSGRIVFKMPMFREADTVVSAGTEARFLELAFVQVQQDFLRGRYAVDDASAVELCALQMCAQPAAAGREGWMADCVTRYLPPDIASGTAVADWTAAVLDHHQHLAHTSRHTAMLQFVRQLAALPSGLSVFYPARLVEDPVAAFPGDVVLAVSHRGITFIDAAASRHTSQQLGGRFVELRDIMQFGSSSQVLFLRLRINAGLHIFQFGTTRGDDVCTALNTHAHDALAKHYQSSTAPDLLRVLTGQGQPEHPRGMHQRVSVIAQQLGDANEKTVCEIARRLAENARIFQADGEQSSQGSQCSHSTRISECAEEELADMRRLLALEKEEKERLARQVENLQQQLNKLEEACAEDVMDVHLQPPSLLAAFM